MENGTTPVTGLPDLEAHLDALLQDPALAADAKLFDHVELQLTEANIPPLIPALLPKITGVLKQYAQDPQALASLAIKLLGPVSFTQVMALASVESLVQALRSPAPSANILAMTVLHKAAASPSDAAILSSMAELVAAFLTRWLAAPQVEVGEKGSRVLGDLLDVDCPLPPPPVAMTNGDAGSASAHMQLVLRKAPGQGMLWRRIFQDRQVYALIPSLCTGRHPEVSSSAHQATLAQGRLLRVLPRLAALDFAAVGRPSPVEAAADSSLLHFGALQMVDKSDMLMHLSLVDFYETLVSVLRVTDRTPAKVEALRALLRDALREDEVLKEALSSLPERTVPEEADALRAWLSDIMPGVAIRVGGWTG
ncbi:uncharacterized protein E0L32_010295 [Thyridium curvatum]|uniref:DNA mismatch repair protein HSM3 N-terminal domain-containing protein n=1 Tax=Thyridium curvatum TaxID=1093900 RepID=A0A507ANM6_9PEZI|nr:uncharacterized protein E0L32_010295 [Thyridium curvatum]TPX07964.1 hypothetical protein E0L32_010295 [Thyridium curvatum]